MSDHNGTVKSGLDLTYVMVLGLCPIAIIAVSRMGVHPVHATGPVWSSPILQTLKLLNTKDFIDLIDDTIKTRDFNNQTLNIKILIKIIKAIATIIA
ncbi:hypothetical protein C0989_001746 [Termitomyces sp. Mn162]|nr:hypothetical protein C0989_001746 [Termitomyces sp. Mn162]